MLAVLLSSSSGASAAAPTQTHSTTKSLTKPADEATAPRAGETCAYQGPEHLVVSPDARTVYVACADARQIAWVDLESGRVTRRVDVPARPGGLGLTPDGKRLVVACAAIKSTVVVLDAKTGEQQAAVPAGHTAAGVAIGAEGKRAYVCNRFSTDVSVIDLEAGRQIGRIPAEREPVAAAVTPDGRTLVVANHLPNTRTDIDFRGDVAPLITLVDLPSGNRTAIELPHGANGLRSLCVMPDGRHVLVTHLLSNFEQIPFRVDTGWINTNVISVVDLKQAEVVASVGLDRYDRGSGNPWGVTCTGDGKWVCVTLSGTHELAVIKTSELLGDFARRTMQPMMGVWPIYVSLGESLWRRQALPGKGPRGIAAVGSKVVVAEYFSDSLAVIDPSQVQRDSDYSVSYYGGGDEEDATQKVSSAQDGADEASADHGPVSTIRLGPRPELTTERWGELLFHDATICYQHWQSCASCHPDGRADALNWDLQNDGPGNSKNTKSLLLSHETPPSMGEGVRATAEIAVRSGLSHILFTDRPEAEAAAMDVYLKSLEPVPSPHLVDGRLSEAARRGRELFQSDRVGCYRCHPAPLYTDMRPHPMPARQSWDRGKRFDTPTLIEVWRTAPYLHDGRYPTVKQLLIEGRHGLTKRRLQKLTEQQIDDLVAFVLSL